MTLATPAGAVIFETFPAEVIGIKDGDTIVVLREKTEIDIRLNGVDSPEKGQAFGTKAKQWTAMAAFGQMVTVKETSLDKYGRTVADVLLPDGKSLNQEIVRAGFAWWFRRYSEDQVLKQLEQKAREIKCGLWFDKDPIPPWEWRRAKAAGKEITQESGQ
jgi:endonuclease YncB( thermonuclease family)